MSTVLIIGASRGLGLEFARAYAAEGWRVIATCRRPDTATELNQFSGNIVIRAMDITQPEQIKAVAGEFVGQPLDLLINNAGIHGPRDARGTFGDVDVDAWIEVLKTNTIGPIKVTEAFLPQLQAGNLKKLVFISSRAGSITERGALPHQKTGGPYIYRTSKAALNAAAKAIAFDLRPQGISVMVLHPGWVKTETGGWDAPGDAATNVAALRKIIERCTPADNGVFLNVDGTIIPW
jgi:NAD(P)-dependent dehydrogenase (short-subunit alcohol dehydrogenase family)